MSVSLALSSRDNAVWNCLYRSRRLVISLSGARASLYAPSSISPNIELAWKSRLARSYIGISSTAILLGSAPMAIFMTSSIALRILSTLPSRLNLSTLAMKGLDTICCISSCAVSLLLSGTLELLPITALYSTT